LIKVVETSLNGTLHDGLVLRNADSEEAKQRLEQLETLLTNSKQWPLLRSVYGNYTTLVPSVKSNEYWTGEPPYTNFTAWKGTLDYIFMFPIKQEHEKEKESLLLRSILEIPPENVLNIQTALPSDTFPSDHISIGCTFELL